MTIDAEEGTIKMSGEVDPKILLRALTRTGKHAELVWMKLEHPSLNHNNNNTPDSNYHNNNHHYYSPPIIYGYERYNRALPQNPRYNHHQQWRRQAVEYPSYSTNYAYASQPRRCRHRRLLLRAMMDTICVEPIPSTFAPFFVLFWIDLIGLHFGRFFQQEKLCFCYFM